MHAADQPKKNYKSLLENDYKYILKAKTDVLNALDQYFIPQVRQHLSRELEFISELKKEVLNNYSTKGKSKQSLKEAIASRDRLLSMISSVWLAPEPVEFNELYSEYSNRLEAIIEETDSNRVEIQLKERFYRQPGDSPFLRFAKLNKRIFHRITSLPLRVKNLFVKKKSPISFWRHSIPLRNLVTHYYSNLLNREFRDLSHLFHKKFAGIYLELKHVEEQNLIHPESLNLEVFNNLSIEVLEKQVISEIQKKISNSIDRLTESLIDDFEMVGTIELSAKKFSNKKLARNNAAAYKLWNKNHQYWKNTLYALFEEWRTDIELYRLKFQSIAAFEVLKKEQKQRLEDQVVAKVDLIRLFVDEAKSILSSGEETSSKLLKKVLIQSKKQLDKNLVPSLTEAVSSKNFLNTINSLEHVTRSNIESISDDHIIIKSSEYAEPLAPNDLYITSPYELISFELLSKFESIIEEIKNDLFLAIEKSNAVFRDIDHIIIFSITSAIAILEEEDSKDEDAIALAIEGIDRANNRLNEGLSLLTEGIVQSTDALQVAMDQFALSLLDLTNNDNVFELKVRITKAKTLQQAEEVGERIKARFLRIKTKTTSSITASLNSLNKFIQDTKARFILTAKTQELSREMSDFLLESQSAMDKLPTIYHQLYKIEPLNDMELFVGREDELERFKSAVENWEKGRFASTIIIGEKWGGQTSLLNNILKSKILAYPIHRAGLPKNLSTEANFFNFIKELIKKPELQTVEELVEHLNEGRKRVIILENLQNTFFRKIGGFEGLNFLFDLISQTSINVFWVSSTTNYSWAYLEKTVKINEYFSYAIKMGIFSNEQIKEIIWKRNSISGFQIRFEPDSEHLASKKYKKLSEEEKQALLEAEFFKALCDFAKSNVSMALVFWLLSTYSVDTRQITIGTFRKPNLNFLTALSSDKIQILYALILHDGLSEEEISAVQHVSAKFAKQLILSLMEDSIIVEKEEIYSLNPLIYRDAISILKTKNLLLES